jgi:hypothetical protein
MMKGNQIRGRGLCLRSGAQTKVSVQMHDL